ncbi:hypothetical protein B9G98_03206 [Wickerhamiella sorbophila]|uniref:Oxidoreductase n=1 Tax=Wickerhamiella sorbophila TaxID=45607 RepID=A0A2T0FKR8_9ASCO|nr:hypothetical protein B9G98_03206 [Wickerhamiella sorbophila]PRT55586.1 hypothetical protein B9G98_03206 [Wickerhamiella sorbophila]
MNIVGKVVVITGASSGLGQATAHALAGAGAKVVVGARRLELLRTMCKDLGQPEEAAVQTDVTKPQDLEKLVKTAVDLYGRVDVLVNNAGYMTQGNLEEGRVSEWDTCIDINVKGVLYGVNAIVPYFKRQKSGQIINIGSVSGRVVYPGSVVYCASKFAVRAISEGLRQELKPYNVRVLNMSPGVIETEMEANVDVEPMPASAVANTIAYAIGQPENVDVNEIIMRPTLQES